MACRSVFDLPAIRSEFEKAGISIRFIAPVWKYVLQNPNIKIDFDEVPSLPTGAYPLLRSKFRSSTSTLDSVVESDDNITSKLLIRLQDGAFVEAVVMRYDSRMGRYAGKPRPGGPRSTLCISSQVGCKMGCKFCATGSMGFKRNLSSGEIVEQLVHASHISHIRNIVFMGMGEPLNNYAALVEAVRIMTGFPFQLSPKRITISTVGIIHAVNKLQDDLPNVNLAVSLHAPVQDIRCQIMPAARAFPLVKLMDALLIYQRNSKQKIFIEYIMLDGVNDEEQHAHQLGKLLQTLEVVVNLIPFNPIGISNHFRTSNEHNVKRFQSILRGYYGIRTTIRKQMGQDISSACETWYTPKNEFSLQLVKSNTREERKILDLSETQGGCGLLQDFTVYDQYGEGPKGQIPSPGAGGFSGMSDAGGSGPTMFCSTPGAPMISSLDTVVPWRNGRHGWPWVWLCFPEERI
ncbi:hypothetical protein NE237_018245 [Protea cynaroides]|uniref:Radical SAM core domain-containing protein n=1 Tax=Protea cynaroides TaxID=273540 RepID=A0A9Q0K9N6_9MAGN|nr:hypothetical protein NE237_018245 [Protea cynaroides]